MQVVGAVPIREGTGGLVQQTPLAAPLPGGLLPPGVPGHPRQQDRDPAPRTGKTQVPEGTQHDPQQVYYLGPKFQFYFRKGSSKKISCYVLKNDEKKNLVRKELIVDL